MEMANDSQLSKISCMISMIVHASWNNPRSLTMSSIIELDPVGSAYLNAHLLESRAERSEPELHSSV